jgi:exodeoxyribonuclease VII large subunit
MRQRIADLDRRAHAAVVAETRSLRERLSGREHQLVALDPKATLKRGYAVVHKGGAAISSVAEVETGDPLVVRLADGGFPAVVAGAPGRRRARAPRAAPDGGPPETERGLQPQLFV